MSREINGLKSESLVVEGPDGVGKEFISNAVGRELYSTEALMLDGRKYDRHEVIISEATFPFYPFPSGDFIRLMNKGLGSEYADLNQLSVDEEVRLRKAMYAVDRYLFYMAESLYISESVDDRHKVLLRIQDRSALSQIHTEVSVYLRRGLEYKLDVDRIMDSDRELIEFMNFRNVVLIPYASSTSALGGRKAETIDELESANAQELATRTYMGVAINKFLGTQPIPVQHQFGKWREKEEIVKEIFERTKILPYPSDVEDWMDMEGILNRRFRKGGVSYEHSAYDIASRFTHMIGGIMQMNDYDRRWLNLKRTPADSFPAGIVKKDLMYEEEFRVARKVDYELRRHRLRSNVLDEVPQYLVEGIVRLFTDYTDGRLWDFNKYIYDNKLKVLKDGLEPDPLYGRGYLLFLRELFEFSRDKLGQA